MYIWLAPLIAVVLAQLPGISGGGGEGDGADPCDSVMGEATEALEVPGGVSGAR